MSAGKHTPGPWEYIPGNENHGPYVANHWGAGDICDCYTMSKPDDFAVCNGGTSKPVNHQGDDADANARLIAAAPDLLAVAKAALAFIDSHVADPDITEEMVSKYNALKMLEPHDVIARAEGRA